MTNDVTNAQSGSYTINGLSEKRGQSGVSRPPAPNRPAISPSEEVPRGLVKRGKTWHISRAVRGRMVRVTTGCTTLEAAKQRLAQWERYGSKDGLDSSWREFVISSKSDPASWLHAMMRGAKKRKSCTLDIDGLVDICLGSGGRCAITGIEFDWSPVNGRKVFAASLDRIECSEGYHIWNCRLVCHAVNIAMNSWGEAPLKRIALAIAARHLEGESRL